MPEVLPLFHRYKDDVYRLALSCTRSPQEAEDICQSVYPDQDYHYMYIGEITEALVKA